LRVSGHGKWRTGCPLLAQSGHGTPLHVSFAFFGRWFTNKQSFVMKVTLRSRDRGYRCELG
ncbi:hypothetical protein, partial [Salmonella sp. SAL4436]|uniref:hypothetical protein n=1 Tax=Salmonella sp. SAL4436 TaxID=3159891 RepID=UPI00397B504A